MAAGERAVLVFCAQHTGIEYASLADDIHPAYGEEVREALAAGVEVVALGCLLEPGEIRVVGEVPFDPANQVPAARKAVSVST